MKKIISVILIITFIIPQSFAASRNRSGKILDDFKERQKVLLFENVPFTSEDENVVFVKDNEISNLQETMEKLEAKKNKFQEKKKEIKVQKLTLAQAIEDIDSSIKETETSVEEIKNFIKDNERNIKNYEEQSEELELKIESSKKTILEYLSYIYSKWDMVYEWEKVDLLKSVLLNDWNVSDVFNDIYLKSLIEATGQNFIQNYRGLVADYYTITEELKEERIENIQLKNKLLLRKADLNEQKTYKQQLLEETKWQEALFTKFILDQKKKQEGVKTQIQEIENTFTENFSKIIEKYNCSWIDVSLLSATWSEEIIDENSEKNTEKSSTWVTFSWTNITIKESPECAKIKKYFDLEVQLRQYPTTNYNRFNWPVATHRWISAYYMDPGYKEALWSEHEAIDIRTQQWTDIVAPAAWYVYFINAPARWNYSYVALKHADWYVTVYGHLSEVFVKPFEFVKPGQLFAKTWWARWTPWAWPMTSWPHLHYEMYRYKNSIDPLLNMDISGLNYNELDEKYKIKFARDLQKRYWNNIKSAEYQKFFLEWSSEVERQKALLNKYASADFKDWNAWVEESVSANIDPSFLMCVWLAETWLGRHLKTRYNVWNVWNTDSGWTYSFDWARDWIYWMTKTFNNRYLKQYQTLDQLSRWWNQTWPIYASSPKNWHNNIVRCVSSLKGYVIEDDYQFRIK